MMVKQLRDDPAFPKQQSCVAAQGSPKIVRRQPDVHFSSHIHEPCIPANICDDGLAVRIVPRLTAMGPGREDEDRPSNRATRLLHFLRQPFNQLSAGSLGPGGLEHCLRTRQGFLCLSFYYTLVESTLQDFLSEVSDGQVALLSAFGVEQIHLRPCTAGVGVHLVRPGQPNPGHL
ncbi:hypothetical protein XAUC_02100 [Xanthomonas citri pv. aurantifolii str. ICPB 10535]|nr:hypothetical protein XAUC_02100 [Xanthomonas citri pv. aurantifolii str. ICPB 10535]